MIYAAVNEPVLERIPESASRMLDIGCGSGTLGERIKKKRSCEVVGVTYSPEEARLAQQCIDQVIVGDLNDFDPQPLGTFDCIVCSHVLEHLYQPQKVLERLRGSLTAGGVLIVALPNLLIWKQRLVFLRGRFRYADSGLLDRTHFRFFDWQTAYDLVRDAGYQVTERVTVGYFPLPGLRRRLPGLAARIDRKAVALAPGLFGEQFILVGQPKAVR